MPEQGLVKIEGAEEIAALARRMKEVGDRDLIPTLRREMTAGTKDTRRAVRDRIRQTLPQQGGLNRWAGTMPTLSSHIEPGRASVKLRLAKRGHDLPAMNRGTVRHPLFGNRRHWFTTPVPAGWFEASITGQEAETLRGRVAEAVGRAVETAVMRHGPAT